MGIFRRSRTRTAAGAVVSDRQSSKADLEALREFAENRNGVEAYMEPKTSVTQMTMLLVAADGESLRRRVTDAKAARDLAKKLKIPVYDANKVGYPSRMREFNRRKAGNVPRSPKAAPTPARATPKELAAIMTLESIAGVDPLPTNPERDELLRVWKKAKAAAHPDRQGGDRTRWDKVEESARALNLNGAERP